MKREKEKSKATSPPLSSSLQIPSGAEGTYRALKTPLGNPLCIATRGNVCRAVCSRLRVAHFLVTVSMLSFDGMKPLLGTLDANKHSQTLHLPLHPAVEAQRVQLAQSGDLVN